MKKEKGMTLRYNNIVKQRTDNLLKSKKSMLGIDIGSGFIKIVQIKKNKAVRAGIKAIPDGLLNQGRILEISQLSNLIKAVMKENRISGNRCSLCISGNEIIVRELKLPEMGEAQIMENIKHEITSFLPIKQEEYCIDYKILEYIQPQEEALGKLRIMVAAAPDSMVHSYIDALRLAKIKTLYVDVTPNISGKLAKQITKGIGGNIGIIDFGANTTNFTVIKDGNYVLHKSLMNGGEYLTSQLAQKYGVDMLEAEEIKKKTNLFENNYQNGKSSFIETYMDYLTKDIERTIEFFKNKNNHIGVEVIYITGGGSLLKGLNDYLRGHFSMEIIPLSNALKSFCKNADKIEPIAFYSQAIGTTLREG